MFDAIRDFFGAVYVKEKDGIITIGGINSDKLLADINAIWGNTRVVKLIFISIKKHSVSFYSFFGVDILYICAQVTEFKRRKSNRYRIRQAIDALLENTWLKRMDYSYKSKLDFSQLNTLLYTLRDHQLNFLNQYDQKTQKMGLNGFLLAAAPGAGKTLMGLALSVTLDIDNAILLAPKTILDNVWTDGIIEQFGGKATYWTSTSNERIKKPSECKYYVVHFDALNKLIPIVNQLRNRKTLIILDESHNFNDSRSLRSRMFVSFCHMIGCRNVVFSSGTPIKALGFECITLLQCIDPLFTPAVEEIFRKIFGVSSKRAVDILRHRIDLIGHKIPREIFMAIPPPIIKQIRVKLPNGAGRKYTVENVRLEMRKYIEERLKYYADHTKKYLSIYEDCINTYKNKIKTQKERDDYNKYISYINDIRLGYDAVAHKDKLKFCKDFEKNKLNPVLTSAQKKAFKDAISVVRFVQLKVLGEALGIVLTKRRVECHCEMIPHIGLIDLIENADKKTLCFSSFVEVLEKTKEYLINNGLQPTVVHGKVDRTADEIIKNFKDDPELNPMLATFQSMSAGITLVICNVMIFLNMPFRSYIHEQSLARAFRIGQNTQVWLFEVTLDTGTESNISTRSQDIMEWSRQQVEQIMGKDVSPKEMAGIVDRLNLNPETRVEKIIHKFQDLLR